jgi:16S rRNA (guanine966-N2)-methyltransferase
VRIIAGTARATRLQSLSDPALRPMLDRVKESLFAIVRNLLEGACVLDLFSGSGSLGLEALSRGARSCVFVEEDPALLKLIARNAERCHFADRCETVRADVLALGAPPQGLPGLPADLVFADPPYARVDEADERKRLFEALDGLIGAWVLPQAVLALHHRPMPLTEWPTARLAEWDRRVYGHSQLTFFEVREDAADG